MSIGAKDGVLSSSCPGKVSPLALFDMPNSNRYNILSILIQYFIDIDILQNSFINIDNDINIFKKVHIDIDINIDIFKNDHVDIDIFQIVLIAIDTDFDIFKISLLISIFFKSVDISTIDISYRYIEQG